MFIKIYQHCREFIMIMLYLVWWVLISTLLEIALEKNPNETYHRSFVSNAVIEHACLGSYLLMQEILLGLIT